MSDLNLLIVLVFCAQISFFVSLFALSILKNRLAKQKIELSSREKELSEMTKEIDLLKTQISELHISGNYGANKIENHHDVIKVVAGKISEIANTLDNLDPNARGVNHLRRYLRDLRLELKQFGYDITPLLGSEWTKGDIIDVNLEEIDDTVEPGKHIVSRILIAEIKYNGKLWQRGKVNLKYN